MIDLFAEEGSQCLNAGLSFRIVRLFFFRRLFLIRNLLFFGRFSLFSFIVSLFFRSGLFGFFLLRRLFSIFFCFFLLVTEKKLFRNRFFLDLFLILSGSIVGVAVQAGDISIDACM